MGVDRADAVRIDPVVLGTAGGKQVQMRQQLRRGIGETVDDLAGELGELSTGDDGDLDPRREIEQQPRHARIHRLLRRGERVIQLAGDELR